MVTSVDIEPAEVSRHRRLPRFWSILVSTFAVLAIALAVNQLLNLQLFVGVVLLDNRYLYMIITLLLPLVFIVFPAGPSAPADRVPWYDVALFLLTVAIGIYLSVIAVRATDEGWEFGAPVHAIVVSVVCWAVLLEAARRAAGWSIFFVVLVCSLYPVYASALPGPISGFSMGFFDVAAFHILSLESLLGIPTRVFANLVIGFIVFGVALQETGAGKFFIDLAFALFGHVRGGPAKVAIFSSGLLGSVSGSVVTNIMTTGAMTIPAMKRIGFTARYAAGVEACASTGGVLMPPIMGATAFVMASFLGVPYVTVAIAAVIPSLLYYFGLFMQIDAYSARRGLQGMPRSELPRVRDALLAGWHYIAVFVFLVWILAVQQQESLAPFYSTVLLIVINQLLPSTRWKFADFLAFIRATARLFAEIIGMLAGIGLIIGALSMTGVAGTLTNDLVFLAGGNPFVLLLTGAITSFILGIGMTVTAAYIFLAIVLAPALVKVGLDPLAVHMFLLYWGMLSFITPPVAIGAFAAASLAQARPMETGFEAMRLGTIIYFIPFFFVLNPALIFHGSWYAVIFVCTTAVIGVVLLSSGLQGYLTFVGGFRSDLLGWIARAFVIVGGLVFALPGGGLIPFSQVTLLLMAVAVSAPGVLIALWQNRAVPATT